MKARLLSALIEVMKGRLGWKAALKTRFSITKERERGI